MPLASQTSFVRHLSIASADAITPLPVYGIAQRLERALHGAVLAEPAVQRDEHAVEAFALEVEELPVPGVERVRVHALLDERRQHRVARQERDLALRRRPAHQHGDLAEFAHARLRGRGGRASVAQLADHLHFGLEIDAGPARAPSRERAR